MSPKDKPPQPSVGLNNHQVKEAPSREVIPATLLVDSLNAALVETATAALPIWRDYALQKPALVLFSNDPFLTMVPEPLQSQVMVLVKDGTPAQIQARAVDITANPLLMHTMAVDAALRAGFFSELIWVVPIPDDQGLPPLEEFRGKMVETGLASQSEADSLVAREDHYVATLRGIPVSFGTLSTIPRPKVPAWIHIDLSFFKPFYKNGVSTPLYPLIFDALGKIREAGLNSIGASISLANLGGAIALKIRFLGQDLVHILDHPAALNEDLPELQFRRTQNLYLEQFIKKDDILENCVKMEALAPKDPSVKYDLYSVHREMQKGNQALEYLAQAVAIDPMYAYEYFYLAETALEKGRPDAALEMLKKARETFPDNPVILLMEADLQLLLGRREPSLALISQLQALPWSEVYDQDVPERLQQMKDAAEALPTGH